MSSINSVIVIYLENFDFQTALAQPYFASLWKKYGQARNYFGVCYPSAPNYLAFAGGTSEQCGSDECNPGKYDAKNLGDLIESAGKTWIAYAESAPSNCPANDIGDFACRHFPWTYYSDIWNNKTRCDSHCVAIADLVNDFPYSKTPENFVWITPNVKNDGHNTSPAYAASWLSQFLPKLMAQSWFENSVIFLTTDTGDPLHNGYTASDGTVINGGQVICVAISSHSLGTSYSENACHYNLLSSVMDILELSGTLGKGGTSAFPAMKSLYAATATPPPAPPSPFIYGVTPTADVVYPASFLQRVTKDYFMKYGELEGRKMSSDALTQEGFDTSTFILTTGSNPTEDEVKTSMGKYPEFRFIELFNESESPQYGGHSPQEAFNSLKLLYPLIKQLKPNAIVLAPTPTIFYGNKGVPVLNTSTLKWTKDLMALGAGKYFDVASIHVYPGALLFDNPSNQKIVSDGLDQYHSIFGKDIFITETGHQSTVSQQEQGDEVTALSALFKSKPYIKGMYWYRMTDYGQPNAKWGLFDAALNPKQAAYAYKNLIVDP